MGGADDDSMNERACLGRKAVSVFAGLRKYREDFYYAIAYIVQERRQDEIC